MSRSTALFDLADDLAELLGCPVTIENPDTVVVAYAGDHRFVDEARIETILNRQVPRALSRSARAGGSVRPSAIHR